MAFLLGMSLSIAGIGGLLTGLIAKRKVTGLIVAIVLGFVETLLVQNPTFILIALFWFLVGSVLRRIFSNSKSATN